MNAWEEVGKGPQNAMKILLVHLAQMGFLNALTICFIGRGEDWDGLHLLVGQLLF